MPVLPKSFTVSTIFNPTGRGNLVIANPRNPCRVLTYHKVDPKPELGVTCIHPNTFEKQIELLVSMGYSFSTISGLADNSNDHQQVAISFDDGYKNIADYAFPVLSRLNIPATVFVITDFIGRDNRWDVALGGIHYSHLEAEDIRKLHRAGWEIGSHSLTHQSLRGLTQVELRRQLRDSKGKLEDLIGQPVESFAPPFGNVSPRIIDAAVSCGYRKVCGFFPLKYYNSPTPPHLILRLAVYRCDTSRSLLAKLSVTRLLYREVLKQNIINFCSNATIAVKSLQ